MAGVDRATRWMPGRCLSVSGSKVTVRLEDGRVIQRHLDRVVPRTTRPRDLEQPAADWTAAPLTVSPPSTGMLGTCGERGRPSSPVGASREVRDSVDPCSGELQTAEPPGDVAVRAPVQKPVESPYQSPVLRDELTNTSPESVVSPQPRRYNLRPRRKV